MATLVVVYALGRLLYGPRAGIVAMLLLAVMPYHVIVTRQVLLDGPMVFFATAGAVASGAVLRRAREPCGWSPPLP